MKNKKKLMLLIIPLVVVAGILVFKYAGGLSGDNHGVINLSGNIEATDAQAQFKLADKVKKKLLNEEKTIEKDELIVTLDANEFEKEVAIRRADFELARAVLAELEAGSRRRPTFLMPVPLY